MRPMWQESSMLLQGICDECRAVANDFALGEQLESRNVVVILVKCRNHRLSNDLAGLGETLDEFV
jgi:hypothetical protein